MGIEMFWNLKYCPKYNGIEVMWKLIKHRYKQIIRNYRVNKIPIQNMEIVKNMIDAFDN